MMNGSTEVSHIVLIAKTYWALVAENAATLTRVRMRDRVFSAQGEASVKNRTTS